MAKYQLKENGVIDTENNLHIPNSMSNIDWVAYQEWLSQGNTPDPLPPPYVPTDADLLGESDLKMIRAVDWLLQYLVANNVVQLADIPAPLKTLYLERKAQRQNVGSPQT